MTVVNLPPDMVVECPTCERVVQAVAAGVTEFYEPSEGPPERWTLAACPAGHPMLVLQLRWSGMDFDDDTPTRMYPPRDRQLSTLIPEELRSAHEEARRCFRAKAHTAAVVMSGRLLEGACEKQGVKERTLQKSLDKMQAEGIIDGRLADWADTLRHVRNSAAHFTAESVTRQDAEDALAYSEALLDYLYVLKDRFESMKARRQKVQGKDLT